MVSTKIMEHRENSGGGGAEQECRDTFSQMILNRGLVLSVAQATLSLRSIRLPEMCYFL